MLSIIQTLVFTGSLALASVLPGAVFDDNRDTHRVVLLPLQETNIRARVSGTVETVTKKMGECFDKGEILIVFDPIIFRAEMEKAFAQLEKAEWIL
ncbi:MAG: hypothetical protein KDK40_02030, partial [Chlamydiia bacterium]|nr:hypothetical protein [Chlamydiia bacterium]